jgi:rRNA maturation RNase YbeY
MIVFNYENSFSLSDEKIVSDWIIDVMDAEGFEGQEINYIFCSDDYLHKLNVQYLNHDTLTDIISFDNSVGNMISGDIFISTDRVEENAIKFNVSFDEELRRVMIHGVLHFMGFKDKTENEATEMRFKENEALKIFK